MAVWERAAMLKHLLTPILFVALFAFTAPAPAQGPWTELADADLQEMHRLIVSNHPGPVDPRNPGFRVWLEEGLKQARERAASAQSFSDYKRALLYYVNGFSDGHLSAGFPVNSTLLRWPGFLPSRAEDGSIRVAVSEDSDIPVGARLVACDGAPVERLLEERVYPYWWNREIPHQSGPAVPRLMIVDYTDERFQLASCEFEAEGRLERRGLRWRLLREDRASRLRTEALGRVKPELGIRKIGDVWFVSLPTFNAVGDEGVEAFNLFFAELEARADELRRGTLVLDVRGNGGGSDGWGNRVVDTVWGEDWRNWVSAGFDDTVDWRVSPDNIERNRGVVEELEREGFPEWAQEYRQLVSAMEQALREGRELLLVEDRPADPGPQPPNPVTGRAFFLTDDVCFSACLGFADLVRRMPGVRHVGLPTAADAVYMENIPGAILPSGLATLSYSLKVDRNRVRGHNEWYEPHVRWPGGPMTDEALAAWVNAISAESSR